MWPTWDRMQCGNDIHNINGYVPTKNYNIMFYAGKNASHGLIVESDDIEAGSVVSIFNDKLFIKT